jgi:hypothetical protein
MRRIPTTVVIEKCLIVIDIGKIDLLLIIYCMVYLTSDLHICSGLTSMSSCDRCSMSLDIL